MKCIAGIESSFDEVTESIHGIQKTKVWIRE